MRRDRFAEPVRVDELARVAALSPSASHRQFRAVTALTPRQYRQQLRLLEARRVPGGLRERVAVQRNYARMFGAPPRRDTAAVRAVVAGEP